MPLPLFSIGGPKEMLVMDIDDVRIFTGALTDENAGILTNLQPVDTPEDQLIVPVKDDANGGCAIDKALFGTVAVLTAYTTIFGN
ncbi:hypothetical protein GNI_182010 [Gregarina niphandrodes]|uniref:Uncharacterized protein n=1 Tax=Gregarina niphandrodes TaxID=110365 RepID=A0A023AX95_GRENI|nr:hypothetical protein GNI_182010 [Gregarina niphandrodes]EZG43217.1 hypothetical protein GNI_182010 [Gregarina niphandrodes]|eukprot:XP_011133526.1 hypothetical protein GNI_182010 [Gregarina niphandrodes]